MVDIDIPTPQAAGYVRSQQPITGYGKGAQGAFDYLHNAQNRAGGRAYNNALMQSMQKQYALTQADMQRQGLTDAMNANVNMRDSDVNAATRAGMLSSILAGMGADGLNPGQARMALQDRFDMNRVLGQEADNAKNFGAGVASFGQAGIAFPGGVRSILRPDLMGEGEFDPITMGIDEATTANERLAAAAIENQPDGGADAKLIMPNGVQFGFDGTAEKVNNDIANQVVRVNPALADAMRRIKEAANQQGHRIGSMQYNNDGSVSVKIYDADGNLVSSGKINGSTADGG